MRKISKSFSDKFPDLVKEWSLKNDKSASEVSYGSSYRAIWVCPKGHEWEGFVYNRSNGWNCPYCSNKKILVGYNDLKHVCPDLIPEWSKKNTISPESITFSSGKKVWWVCGKNHEWLASPNTRNSRGTGCPHCAGNVLTKGHNDLESNRPDLLPYWSSRNSITPSQVTKRSDTKTLWICGNGHEWAARVADVCEGHWCPICSKSRMFSTGEKEVLEYIKELLPGTEIKQNTRGVIPPKELDIFIPDKNIAVEFNGLYYHSEKYVNHNYHFDKWDSCDKVGVQLLTIWEDDWINKKDIVKSMISHKLGINRSPKVYARNTSVVSLSYKDSSEFLDKYHIQGGASGSFYLGLMSDNDNSLVAVMVLKQQKDSLILERYATSCRVVGGQSKLLSYVDREVPYTQMVTFADLTISNGSLYERTGWELDKRLKPDYKYIVGKNRVHKFNFRLKNFKDRNDLQYREGLSERELSQLNGLLRVYDCGKLRYVRTKDD